MYKYIIKEYDSTVWEETDGRENKYRYALNVYLVKIVSLSLKISLYREIGSPGHGKYFVDGLKTIDKRYLR